MSEFHEGGGIPLENEPPFRLWLELGGDAAGQVVAIEHVEVERRDDGTIVMDAIQLTNELSTHPYAVNLCLAVSEPLEPEPVRQFELAHGLIRLDLDTQQLSIGIGTPIHLTKIETALLEILARSEGTIVEYQDIFQYVWQDYRGRASKDTLRQYIASVRKKLDAYAHLLVTVPNVGLRFGESSQEEADNQLNTYPTSM